MAQNRDRDDESRDSRDSRDSSGSSSSPESRYSKEFAAALGRTIKVLRTDLGIERRELAARVGISYSYLTEIENGNKPPSSSKLRPIAHALGLRMSQLTAAAETRLDAQVETETQALLAEPASPSSGRERRLGLETPLENETDPRLRSSPAAQIRFALSPPSRGAPVPGIVDQDWTIQPSLRGPNRDLRATLIELERLLRHMAPDDIERLLDYARRLVR
jgi:transcriptional regulator with XRE-family HTH domain